MYNSCHLLTGLPPGRNCPTLTRFLNFFPATRSSDSVTRLSTVRGPAVTWSFRFSDPTVESVAVVIRDKDDQQLAKIHSAITVEEVIQVNILRTLRSINRYLERGLRRPATERLV